MLKASMNSRYRKPSGWVFTYVVTGPIAEVTEYITVMSARANKTPEEWQKTPAGHPLYFVQLNNLLRNGDTPQPSYNLVKSHDGLNYYTDTTAQEMAKYQRIAAASELEQGKLLAQAAMGIITIGTNRPATTPTPTPNAAPVAAPADTIGSIIENGLGEEELIGAGEEGGAAGTQNLAD